MSIGSGSKNGALGGKRLIKPLAYCADEQLVT